MPNAKPKKKSAIPNNKNSAIGEKSAYFLPAFALLDGAVPAWPLQQALTLLAQRYDRFDSADCVNPGANTRDLARLRFDAENTPV